MFNEDKLQRWRRPWDDVMEGMEIQVVTARYVLMSGGTREPCCKPAAPPYGASCICAEQQNALRFPCVALSRQANGIGCGQQQGCARRQRLTPVQPILPWQNSARSSSSGRAQVKRALLESTRGLRNASVAACGQYNCRCSLMDQDKLHMNYCRSCREKWPDPLTSSALTSSAQR